MRSGRARQCTELERACAGYDLAPLEFALRQSVDLAVLIFNYKRPSIARAVIRSGVPFVEFADAKPCNLKGCVGSVCLDKETAMSRLAEAIRSSNVMRVMQVGAYTGNFDANFLRKMDGIRFTNWHTGWNYVERGVNENIVRGAMNSFIRRFKSKGRGWLPDLFYFSDDHVAAGALTAMLQEGVRIPEDVRVVTMSNWGLGPVFPVSLTRLELNPYTHGEALAQMALDYMTRKVPQGRRIVPLQYIEGDSF